VTSTGPITDQYWFVLPPHESSGSKDMGFPESVRDLDRSMYSRYLRA